MNDIFAKNLVLLPEKKLYHLRNIYLCIMTYLLINYLCPVVGKHLPGSMVTSNLQLINLKNLRGFTMGLTDDLV